MPPKTPKFWYFAKPSLKAQLLIPLSMLYSLGRQIHKTFSTPKRAGCPVICVGNLTAGGAGKTPTAIAVMDIVKQNSLAHNPYFLTRGYGGNEKGPLLVDENEVDARRVGDETLELAHHGPIVVSKNRLEGAKYCVKKGADMIILDDGYQNPSIKKDINILVIDGPSGFGNERLLPAGPLREGIRTGLKRAHMVILLGEDRREIQRRFLEHKSVFKGYIDLKPRITIDLHKDYVAFAGIGRPKKFKATLENAGLNIVGWHEFADHHEYSKDEIKHLTKEAQAKNAALITTVKDHMRTLNVEWGVPFSTYPVSLHFNEPEKFKSFLSAKIKGLQH